MNVVRFEILKLPENNIVHSENADRDMIVKKIEAVRKLTLPLLDLLQPEYSDDFIAWCSIHGQSGTYKMVVTDMLT